MPHLETWKNFPLAVRQHLMERMRDRRISIADLDKLRIWVESHPLVPEGKWYKDFGSFKICGEGPLPKTFLIAGQSAEGESL
jgi:hypothetical protein